MKTKCDRCDCEEAEYYTRNFIWCPVCDDVSKGGELKDDAGYQGDMYYDDWDEDTKPGWNPAVCQHIGTYYATNGNVTGTWCWGCGKLLKKS